MVYDMTFSPKWASKPGNTILAAIEKQELSLERLAISLGRPLAQLNSCIEGSIKIDADFALGLSNTIGGSQSFWLNRQVNYEKAVEQLWAQQIPFDLLEKRGYLVAPGSLDDKLKLCYDFFAVASHSEFEERYSDAFTAFRTSPTYDSAKVEVAAWLRLGEILADEIPCTDWDPVGLRAALKTIRPLTRQKDPRIFVPAIQKICSQFGLAVVTAKAPKGCKASGAARFLGPRKSMVLLSGRHLSDDHLWFTFFHEVGHLLLHGRNSIFIDGENSERGKNKEQEADDFAQAELIPEEFRDEFEQLPCRKMEVIRFAKKIDIAPGIVVGQMQHQNRIPRTHLNGLKRRYRWDEGDLLPATP